jgi:hypothetical protein
VPDCSKSLFALTVVMSTFILLTIAIVAEPLGATSISYPVAVPLECMRLAEREHVPAVIESPYQALKAAYKLAHLNKADPLVAECHDAVERLRVQWR